MKNRPPFIFIDIDGTLLDKHYGTNSSALSSLMVDLQKKGHIFALNSNRSLEDLLSVAEQFDLKGPIIGENGMFIFDQERKSKTFLLSEKERGVVNQEIKKIKEIIKNFFKKKEIKNFYWDDVDTIRVLNNLQNLFPTNSTVIFNNKFREFTLSSHIKIFSHNMWRENEDLLKELVDFVKINLGDSSSVVVTYSRIFANLLVYSKSTSKRKAVEYLRKIYPGYEFSAVGDEKGDYEMIKGLGDFYTTGNTEKDIRKLAKYASPLLYTQGVFDILQHIS